jgi:hypothetical protein
MDCISSNMFAGHSTLCPYDGRLETNPEEFV